MPVTDHEKLQVHSWSSSDFLSAVPIKKRRFLISRSPSPPPQLPSQTDDGNDKVACEFHGSPSPKPAASPDRNSESVSGLPSLEIEGNPVHMNDVKSEVPLNEFASEAPAGCPVTEKNFATSSVAPTSQDGVNAVIGEDAARMLDYSPQENFNICGTTLKFSVSRPPFAGPGHILTQVKGNTGENVFSKRHALLSPKLEDCDRPEKKPKTSDSVYPFPETGGSPGQVNSLTAKGAACDTGAEPVIRDLNVGRQRDVLLAAESQGSGLNLAVGLVNGAGNVQEIVTSTSSCLTVPVKGSMVTPPVTDQMVGFPGRQGGLDVKFVPAKVDCKFIPTKGISVKKEMLELQTPGSASQHTKLADSGILCLNRSTWDLNTTMDTWEGTSSDTLSNSGTVDCSKHDLSGIQENRVKLDLLQKEPNEVGAMPWSCGLQDNHHHELSNQRTSVICSNSEACLDLQLKPSFLSNACSRMGELDAGKEMPFLSLGMNISDPPPAIGRAVKSEPMENDKNVSEKAQQGILKLRDLQQAKAEPSKGHEISKTTVSCKNTHTEVKTIKTEPLAEQSQGYATSTDRSSFTARQESCITEPQSTLGNQIVGNDEVKSSGVVSKPLLNTCTNRLDKSISNHSSHMVEKVPDFVNQPLRTENDLPISTVIIQDLNSVPFETSTSLSKSLTSDVNNSNSLPETCERSRSLGLPPETNTLTTEGHISSESVSEQVAQMDPYDAQHSLNASSTGEVLGEPCGNSKFAVSDEVEGNAVLSKIPEEPYAGTCDPGSSDIASASDMDVSDGEDTYRALNGHGITEEREVETSDCANGLDMCIPPPSVVDKDMEIETPTDADIHATREPKIKSSVVIDVPGSKDIDNGLLDSNMNMGSSAVGAAAPDSGIGKLLNTTDFSSRSPGDATEKTVEDRLEKDTFLERKSKSSDLTASPQNRKADIQYGPSGSEEKAQVPKLARSSKGESSGKEGARKDANDKGNHSRIVYLNGASGCSGSGKRNFTLDRPRFSKGDRGRSRDKSFRGQISRSRGSRDEMNNENSRKAENVSDYGHPINRSRSNLRTRNGDDRQNAMRGRRNSDPNGPSNSSNGWRYSRPGHTGEVAVGSSPDGSGRLGMKLTHEEMQNLPRSGCQRRSPMGRLQLPMSHRQDHPDFLLRDHERKMRNMHADMVECSMLPHPSTQFDGPESILIRRERRSMSPSLRRGGPPHVPPNCSKSSLRSQQHPAHQWSSPRRSSDSPGGHRELGRCRSPQMLRLNRMQSPQGRPCFPEEMMVRRRASPPFITQLPNDMVDVGLVRDSGRNIRQFNMIDPRGIMEEEFFGPPMVHGEMRDFGVHDDYVDDKRRCDERRGPIRSFQQQCIASDNEAEHFGYRVEDVPPRVMRLHPHPDVSEGFPGGGGTRNFDVRFRNRLGNNGRLRGIAREQEDEYRHHEEQEWRDAAFNNGRTKRRRF